MRWLRRFDFSDNDLEHIRIDNQGGVLYADSFDFGYPEGVDGNNSGPTSVSPITRVQTHYSHQMTAAARAIAAMKFLMLRSKRVAIRRQSLRRQNMRSMMLRCL